MSMRQSHTAVVERNQLWEGDFITEPYEVGWSHEAIFFVQILRFEEEDSQPNPLIGRRGAGADIARRHPLVRRRIAHELLRPAYARYALLCARVALRRLAAP